MKTRRFTMTELLMVMIIIVFMMGLVVGVSSYARRKAAESRTASLMQQMEIALDQYRIDWGYYPQLAAAGPLQWDDSGFRNPQGRLYLPGYPVDADELHNNPYRDGWGETFMYQCPGTNNPQSYDLWSKGQDGISGNTDDITNWRRN